MLTDKERVSALLINLDDWSWDLFPKYVIDKETGDALIAEIKRYQKEQKKLRARAKRNAIRRIKRDILR